MEIFELTLRGYDGTKAKAHLIKWVKAPNEDDLERWLKAIPWDVADRRPIYRDAHFADGVDVILHTDGSVEWSTEAAQEYIPLLEQQNKVLREQLDAERDVPLCADCAMVWFTMRKTLNPVCGCVFCEPGIELRAAKRSYQDLEHEHYELQRERNALRAELEKVQQGLIRFLTPWRVHLPKDWLDHFASLGPVTFNNIGYAVENPESALCWKLKHLAEQQVELPPESQEIITQILKDNE